MDRSWQAPDRSGRAAGMQWSRTNRRSSSSARLAFQAAVFAFLAIPRRLAAARSRTNGRSSDSSSACFALFAAFFNCLAIPRQLAGAAARSRTNGSASDSYNTAFALFAAVFASFTVPRRLAASRRRTSGRQRSSSPRCHCRFWRRLTNRGWGCKPNWSLGCRRAGI